jgi:1,4-alpha-glucan branching enzyme
MTPVTRADTLPELLTTWLPEQRWFADKNSGTFTLSRTGELMLQEDSGGVGIEVFLVTVTFAGGESATYQVPLTYRDVPVGGLEHALVGVVQDPARGVRWVYDAPHDAAFVAAWLQLLVDQAEVTSDEGARRGEARGIHARCADLPDPGWPSAVLSGEQSNTSVVVGRGVTDRPVIIKLFRLLHDGPNPDVIVQSALAAAGSDRVPAPVGWIEASWNAPDGTRATGHLAFASQYLDESTDAWRMACQAVAEARPFEDQAHALGAVTAQVHSLLTRALPTQPAEHKHILELADQLDERVAWAVTEVPALRPFRAAARSVIDEVRGLERMPTRQQIHGDYHLGQVLHVAERGWVLFDFEGEPLRPLAQRTRPDLALRDIAGMIRSFDYAARHATLGLPAADPRARAALWWAQAAREAFLDGYAQACGADPRSEDVLLRALELDKALYEVVYETRNRPDWVEVPFTAVTRLLEGRGGPAVPEPRSAFVPRYSPDSPSSTVPVPVPSTGSGSENGPSADPGEVHAPPLDEVHVTKPVEAVTEEVTLTTVAEQETVPDLSPTSSPAPAQPRPVDLDVLNRVASGSYHDPHSVLGAHPFGGAVTVRTLRPLAQSVTVVLDDGTRHPMEHELDGIWCAVLPVEHPKDYRLQVSYEGVGETEFDEPYRYMPTLGELDLHLIREGRHEELWMALGAHIRSFDGPLGTVTGTSFAVWAPNARAVRVVADFNHWTGREHAMRSLGSSGVWELFVPGIGEGARYKFEILGRDGNWRQKADPMAFGTECPPATASVVVNSTHEWQDHEWMARRASNTPHTGPMSVYEVHLGSWRQGLSYRELADQLTDYVRDLGFTHVEFMPVSEHPYTPSWGYQVTSYYAPTSRFGSPDDLRYLIDRLHQAGIGVIIDWVPAHFPKDDWALARFDGEPLYEYGDPQRGEHPDWGTLVFNYGRTEVRNFLVANALYWLEEFHIDGLRVDAVASMLYLDYSRQSGQWSPNIYGGREHLEAISFLQEMNATAYKRVPGIVTIAEESTAWGGVTAPTTQGGLGFGLKWNMGWMHDSLVYMSKEPIHRQYHHHQMTFSMIYAFSENFVLPISHDEVVHGKGHLLAKMPGDRWQQLANTRAYLGFMWAHPGKQLLFMGCELGEDQEWSEARSLHWWLEHTPWHTGLQHVVRDLNRTYKDTPALWTQDSVPAGFEWIDANDNGRNLFSFVRRGNDGQMLVCVSNFAALPYEDYRMGLPQGGRWVEVLNTDAEGYAGSGVTNPNGLVAEEIEWNGRPFSTAIRIPPLGTVWLRPEGE